MDKISGEHRSWNMSRIRSKDTAPEKTVRSLLHKMGYRFRLHDVRLPGSPDIVLPRLQTVILVHGCFWHRHKNCKFAFMPKTRTNFWMTKFEQNIVRDKRVCGNLKRLGWRIAVIWECEVGDSEKLRAKLDRLLHKLEGGASENHARKDKQTRVGRKQ